MIALGQEVRAIYQVSRVFAGGHVSTYQYARLANGAWAFRMRSDMQSHRAPLAFSRWRAAREPDAKRLAEYELVGGSEIPAPVDTISESQTEGGTQPMTKTPIHQCHDTLACHDDLAEHELQIVRLAADNDVNGNPRRLFVALRRGAAVAAWDEGYAGTAAIPEAVRHLYAGQTFATTPLERRQLLKTLEARTVATFGRDGVFS